MKQKLDLSGKKFNMLTAIRYVGNDKGGRSLWLFRCDCGNETIKKATTVNRGKIKSCGCLLNPKCRSSNFGVCTNRRTHGMTNTRLYHIWGGMKYRCSVGHGKAHKRYSERGITVCDEWKDFQAFYDWSMANGYNEGLTLDRINNDGNYEPSNCRWATIKEQTNNTSRNHLITYKGETLNVQQWVNRFNSYLQKFYRFTYKGLTDEQAIAKLEEEYLAKNISNQTGQIE